MIWWDCLGNKKIFLYDYGLIPESKTRETTIFFVLQKIIKYAKNPPLADKYIKKYKIIFMVETGHTKVGIMIQKVNFKYLKKKTNT